MNSPVPVFRVTNYTCGFSQNASLCRMPIARGPHRWHTFFPRNNQEAIDET